MSKRESVRARSTRRGLFVRPVELLEPRRLLNGDGRPVGTLEAPNIELWSTTYVFKVTWTDDDGIDVNRLSDSNLTLRGPNEFERLARFWKWVPNDNPGSVTAFYRISAPGGVWSAADNGIYHVRINPHQVRDIHGNSARAVGIGGFRVNVPEYPSDLAEEVNAGTVIVGVDVTQFGAVPNDGRDDTAAIQAAIDSLPRNGDGVPNAHSLIGGIVVLPAGTFNTSAPLRLPPGVRLRGQGDATIILNSSTRSAEAAVELHTYATHGYNSRAGVENLSIITSSAKGIGTSAATGHLVGLRLNELTISAGGVGIDLRAARPYSTEIRNVTVIDPGTTALWIGTPDRFGAVNRISGLTVTGAARSGFRAEQGMVVLGGEVIAEGITFAHTGASVTPLYGYHGPTVRGLAVAASVPTPGNVVARFEDIWYTELDRIDPLGPQRKIELRNAREVRFENLTLLPGAQLADSIAIDRTSHATVQTLRITANTGSLDHPQITVRGVGTPVTNLPAGSSFAEPMGPLSPVVVDVRAFGAVPNDGRDDTAAIQAAINSLSTGSGIPGIGDRAGGLVVLPPGVYNTSGVIEIPSGVWLRGHGTGTVIRNTSADSGRGAFEFVGHPAHGFNVGAAIEDLSIHTIRAMGVRAHESITAGLVDARITGVQISAGGRGIDLGAVRTFHLNMQNVMISNPGTTTMVIGDADGYSADNRIAGVQLQGRVRSGFVPERALVELRGNFLYQNGWIEQPHAAPVLPLLLSGWGVVSGLWLEYPPEYVPDGVVLQFENTSSMQVDRLLHIDPRRRLNLVNARGVHINLLNLSGTPGTLRESIAVDGQSRLSVNMVFAQRDAGLLDHPRVRVDAAYNAVDNIVIQNRVPPLSQNLLVDPLFTSLSGVKQPHQGGGGWTVQWGDALGAVTGTVSVEQGPNGPRLKVQITSNPNNRRVSIIGALNLPASLAPTHGIVRYRVDGPGTALVYTAGYGREYSGRAMNGATAVRSPQPLQSGDQVIFVLPAMVGTWYISGVSMVAA